MAEPAAAAEPAEPGAEAPAPEEPAAEEAAVAEAEGKRYPRRVPEAVVRPPLDVCVDTGATLGEGSRVVLMPDRGVGEALGKRLAKLGAEVLTIKGAPDVEELEGRLEEWKAAGPIQGVYWLPAMDDEGESRERSSRRTGGRAARAGQAAGGDHARTLRPGSRRGHPRQRHPPRRAPRYDLGTAPPPSSAGR